MPLPKNPSATLEDWIQRNAPDLEADIRIHMEELAPEIETPKLLIRMIMTSVRQWADRVRPAPPLRTSDKRDA